MDNYVGKSHFYVGKSHFVEGIGDRSLLGGPVVVFAFALSHMSPLLSLCC